MEDSRLPLITWDLSDLYRDPQDPLIAQDWENALSRARAFQSFYREKNIAALAPVDFFQGLTDYERIQEDGIKPFLYASLRFSEDTQDQTNKALLQKARERWNEIENHLLFFRLALIRLPEDRLQEYMQYPPLKSYGHFLHFLRRFQEFSRAEKEEEIISKKNMTGKSAFMTLFDEFTGSFIFRLEIEGKEKQLTGSEMLSLLHSPDRQLREQAFRLFLDHYGRNQLILVSIFNALVHDAAVEDDLRGYRGPMHQTLLENMVPAETVELIMEMTEAHYTLAQEYFQTKARLLGLTRLKNSDLYAPLPGSQNGVPLNRAKDILLQSFFRFHPRFGRIAQEFFERRWIDAAIRRGKYGGAFCAGLSPSLHPYLLMNYTGTLRDALTLAHEMGHGIHFYLARKQSFLNFEPSIPMAETASVFGEMIMIQALLSDETDPAARQALLAVEIEDIIATVFRQNVLTRFEQTVHHLRRDHLLSADEIADLWLRANQQLFGQAVEMLPEYCWGWAYIPHYIHSRFYCFSYIFGELVVLALYSKFLQEGSAFLPRFIELLESGGADTPANLLKKVGVDISRVDFWEEGFRVIRSLIEELKAL